MKRSLTNHLLGYPQDARLLILNADDFGMCNSINTAIMHTLQEGIVRSTTWMAPCPSALNAIEFLADHPEIPFGVHLTASSDSAHNRWAPLTPRLRVPTLVDDEGYFFSFDDMPAFLAQVSLVQLEVEFRAQIEAVLAAGLQPTHLDWHALRIAGRADILAVIIRLAKEYGLAMRVMGAALIDGLRSQGLPSADYDFVDSYLIDPVNKPARYAQLLHELPPGLSEWAVHPGLDGPELLSIEPAGRHERQADHDFWTSQSAKDLIRAEGIIVLDYRPLQEFWKMGV